MGDVIQFPPMYFKEGETVMGIRLVAGNPVPITKIALGDKIEIYPSTMEKFGIVEDKMTTTGTVILERIDPREAWGMVEPGKWPPDPEGMPAESEQRCFLLMTGGGVEKTKVFTFWCLKSAGT